MQSRITNSCAQPNGCSTRTVLIGWRSRERDEILQPERNPPRPRAAIGQDGGQEAHGVGAARIADGFNVGVLVDVNAGTDGDALRQIFVVTRHAHPDQRFGIGAHMLAQLRG